MERIVVDGWASGKLIYKYKERGTVEDESG